MGGLGVVCVVLSVLFSGDSSVRAEQDDVIDRSSYINLKGTAAQCTTSLAVGGLIYPNIVHYICFKPQYARHLHFKVYNMQHQKLKTVENNHLHIQLNSSL